MPQTFSVVFTAVSWFLEPCLAYRSCRPGKGKAVERLIAFTWGLRNCSSGTQIQEKTHKLCSKEEKRFRVFKDKKGNSKRAYVNGLDWLNYCNLHLAMHNRLLTWSLGKKMSTFVQAANVCPGCLHFGRRQSLTFFWDQQFQRRGLA